MPLTPLSRNHAARSSRLPLLSPVRHWLKLPFATQAVMVPGRDLLAEAMLDAACTDLRAKVKSQDVFLFFLAGHGKTIAGKYSFIPQDFRFQRDDPPRKDGIG